MLNSIASLEEGGTPQPGEILVAVTTNVGWTPISPRATVIDEGGRILCVAIVRGVQTIPAEVGCFNTTSLLKTGEIVRVDGGK